MAAINRAGDRTVEQRRNILRKCSEFVPKRTLSKSKRSQVVALAVPGGALRVHARLGTRRWPLRLVEEIVGVLVVLVDKA